MLEIYSHIRMEAKRKAIQVFSTKPRSYGIVRGIKSKGSEVYSDINLLAAQNSGIGACGFELQTPTVSKLKGES
jgi:hypothetical protein